MGVSQVFFSRSFEGPVPTSLLSSPRSTAISRRSVPPVSRGSRRLRIRTPENIETPNRIDTDRLQTMPSSVQDLPSIRYTRDPGKFEKIFRRSINS